MKNELNYKIIVKIQIFAWFKNEKLSGSIGLREFYWT